MSGYFEQAVHQLKGAYVEDIRNYGFAAGISLQHYPGEPLRRPFELGLKCFEKGFYVRWGGDTVQLAPAFVVTEEQIDSLINAVGEALHELPDTLVGAEPAIWDTTLMAGSPGPWPDSGRFQSRFG